MRNFRVFVQPRNFCHGTQLSRNFGSFSVLLALIGLIFHFVEIWGLEPLSAHNLSFPKFVAVCPKIATSCGLASLLFSLGVGVCLPRSSGEIISEAFQVSNLCDHNTSVTDGQIDRLDDCRGNTAIRAV